MKLAQTCSLAGLSLCFGANAWGQAFSPTSMAPPATPYVSSNENLDAYRMKGRVALLRPDISRITSESVESVRVDAPIHGDLIVVINPKKKEQRK